MRFLYFLIIGLLFSTPQFAQQSDSLFAEYLMQGEEVLCMHFHPYSNLLAIGTSKNHIVLYDIIKKSKVADLFGNDSILSIKFSAFGDVLAASDKKGNIRLWEAPTWRMAGSYQFTAPIQAIAYHTHKNILYAVDGAGYLYEIDYKEGEVEKFKLDDKLLTSVFYSEFLDKVFIGNAIGDIFMFTPENKTLEQFFISDNSPIVNITSQPEDNFIYFASKNGKIAVIDKNTLEYSRYITFKDNRIEDFQMNILGNLSAVSTQDGNLYYLKLLTKEKYLQTYASQHVTKLAFSNDLQFIAVAFSLGVIHIFSINEYKFTN
jgi:WD40 repeat protein